MSTCKEIVRKINEGEYYSIHEAVDAVIGNYDNCIDFNSEVEYHTLFIVTTSIFKFDDGYVSIKGLFDFNMPIEEYCECNYKTKAEILTNMSKEEYQKKYGVGKEPPQSLIARLDFNMKQLRFYQAQVAADQQTIKKYLEGCFDEEVE